MNRRVRLGFAFVLVMGLVQVGLVGRPVASAVAQTVSPTPAPTAVPSTFVGQRDYPVPGGWFYSEESRLPQDVEPYRGFTVVDDPDAAMWTEFRRFGGVDVLGYPLSNRYRYPNASGFIQQAFQRGILQWHPELGQAQLANVFQQFTQAGLDNALQIEGIPLPEPATQLPFDQDAQRRMTWITEDRFLARFFWDPVTGNPFDFQEAAWEKLGLPESYPIRPTYQREADSGKSGAPLYLPYVVQRFQKGGLELFLEDQREDTTIVPGDGQAGCVSLTAVGRLARRFGSGTMIPSGALLPQPPEIPQQVWVTWFVPPLASPTQGVVRFELEGIGFQPGEPVSIHLTPQVTSTTDIANPISIDIPAADSDGSFDQLITARVAAYTISVQGLQSHKTLSPDAISAFDLHVPTDTSVGSSKSVYC